MRVLRVLLVLAASGVWQQARGAAVDVRVGDHGSFGRVVITWPDGVAMPAVPHGQRQGDQLVLDLPGAGAVAVAPNLAVRHVLGVQGGTDQARLVLQPGSTTRIWCMGRRVVVDVFGSPVPGPASGPAPGSAHLPRQVAGQAQMPLTRAPPGPAVPLPRALPAPQGAPAIGMATSASAGAQPRPSDAPLPAEPAGVADEVAQAPASLSVSVALRAVRLPGPGDTILLPFENGTGGAAFFAGGLAHAVFDQSKAIDLAALKDDPVFGGARITLSPGVTHLSMALPPGTQLSLARQAEGWAISVQRAQADRRAAPVRLRDGTLGIGMKQAADAVVLVDGVSGARLLVGTVHAHGDGVLVGHDSPEFRLLPSWEGVAVAAVADRLALKVTREGFALTAAGPALSTLMPDAPQAALEAAGTLTRRFDIPPLSVAALRARLVGDMAAAARAPRLARFRPRLAAAQDMMGLGMEREAASLLDVARRDDPSQEARPDARALLAMARRLDWSEGGGEADDEGIDQPGLGASDEVALWRVLMPRRGTAAPAAARAAVVAADWPLLTAYPAPLRRRLLPLAAAILIEGHAAGAAGALLAASGDLPLHAERARLLAADGHVKEALALLDGLAGGPDRKQAAYALRDATELRLAAHLTTPEAASGTLNKQLYGWREPDFELARRLRIASLQVQAGAFRPALAGLREAGQLFPQAHDRVTEAEGLAIGALVRGGGAAKLAPIDLVALVQDNTDLLGQGEVAASVTPVLVDKLVALDLPERADRLVARLIDSTAEAVPKAMLGVRLAGLRLDQNDAAGALAALDQTMGDALPPEVEARRAVARARALAQLGEDGPALSLLAAQEDEESWTLQARLREKSHDWHGADLALQKLVRVDVPGSGPLSAPQQDLVLRLASAASQAGDGATLRMLADGPARRLSPGPRASLFDALAVQPVREVGDLPRAQREAVAATALPAAWAGYATH